MTSQFGTPLLLRPDQPAERLQRIPLTSSSADDSYDEAWLEDLLFQHPEALPIAEIDSAYTGPIPVCTQLSTRVGPLDVLYVTPEGRLVIVEAKLWRNPEARRKVIAQILDYAAELARWTYDDLQREVAKRTGRGPDSLFAIASAGAPGIDEAGFSDNVARSLREGRFLLLVCGDGIREDLVGIAGFLDRYTTLDLTLGLVELAIFATGDGARLVQPRVLAKTVTVRRQVVRLEVEAAVLEEEADVEAASELTERERWQIDFWTELAANIQFDDPLQPPPKPSKPSNLFLRLPSPRAWITLYFSTGKRQIGAYLTFDKGEPGDTFYRRLEEERDAIKDELPEGLRWDSDGSKHRIAVSRGFAWTDDAGERAEAMRWFAETANQFVNAFRSRIARYQKEL